MTLYRKNVNIRNMRLIQNLITGFLDITYPKICLACKKKLTVSSIDGIVCEECWSRIKINKPPFCYSCGRNLTGKKHIKNICVNCIEKPLYFDRAFSPCIYQGVIRELIHSFKYENKEYLGTTLVKPLIDFIKEYNLPMRFIDLILPVPLHKTKLREREFNQADILSKNLALEFKKEVLQDKLLRTRDTRTQTELNDHERFLNVRGVFKASGSDSLKRKNILLVDDVLTTGATCSEAAFTLKQAGANIVYCITLAN